MNGRLRRTVVLLTAVAAPALGAAAPPRISVAPVNGDPSGTLTRQLRSLLCADFECVPYSKLRKKGRLDFAKVEALKVDGVLVGTSARRGKVLELALMRRSLRPAWKGSYPIGKGGRLTRDSATELSLDVGSQLGGGRPSPPAAEPPAQAVPPVAAAAPAVAAVPPPASPSPPPPAAPPETAPEPPTAVPEQAAPKEAATAPATKPPAESAPPGKRQRAWPLAAVEAGASVSQRKLSYQGVPAGGTGPLGLEANLIVSPAFRLELYPLSLLTQNAFAGIGLFGEYGFSVGLTTKDPGGGADHSTSYSRLGAGLLWRVQPAAQSRFALIPAVSYQSLRFSVGGAPIPGLPDADLSGVKAGVDIEIPIGDAVAILLGAGYVKWTAAGELVGDAFFPSGSAYAIEADAGVSVGLGGIFTLRVLGNYSATRYSFESTPGGTYQATGAEDRYLGGRAMLRAQFLP